MKLTKLLTVFVVMTASLLAEEDHIVYMGQHSCKLADWTKPTLQDYVNIQNFLIKTLPERLKFIDSEYRRERIANFKIIDTKKMTYPSFMIEKFNNESTDAIITYSSQNTNYLYKCERLKHYLRQRNFKGHFIYYNGGWPNLGGGCLKHFMVPYMFKVCAFLEARRLGYKRVLWLDSSLIPLREVDSLFDYIGEHDSLFRLDPISSFYAERGIKWKEIREELPISDEEIKKQPRVGGCVLGLNLSSERVNKFLDIWHDLGLKGVFYKSDVPEELPMSILINQMGFIDKTHNFTLLREIVIENYPVKSIETYFKLHYASEDPFKMKKKKKSN